MDKLWIIYALCKRLGKNSISINYVSLLRKNMHNLQLCITHNLLVRGTFKCEFIHASMYYLSVTWQRCRQQSMGQDFWKENQHVDTYMGNEIYMSAVRLNSWRHQKSDSCMWRELVKSNPADLLWTEDANVAHQNCSMSHNANTAD